MVLFRGTVRIRRLDKATLDLPGLGVCLEGEAGLGGAADPELGFASLIDDPSSSARILSSLASRPPTAWERNEPHPVFFVGAAILDQRGHFVVVRPLGLAINEGRCVPFLQVSPSGDDAADVAQLERQTAEFDGCRQVLLSNTGTDGGGVVMTTAKGPEAEKGRPCVVKEGSYLSWELSVAPEVHCASSKLCARSRSLGVMKAAVANQLAAQSGRRDGSRPGAIGSSDHLRPVRGACPPVCPTWSFFQWWFRAEDPVQQSLPPVIFPSLYPLLT
jgi:hypothetical protein